MKSYKTRRHEVSANIRNRIPCEKTRFVVREEEARERNEWHRQHILATLECVATQVLSAAASGSEAFTGSSFSFPFFEGSPLHCHGYLRRRSNSLTQIQRWGVQSLWLRGTSH